MFRQRRLRVTELIFVLLSCCAMTALSDSVETLRVGLFTDLHAHDANSPLDGFVMVDWAERLAACVESMNAWPADLMIELGDYINGRFVLGGEFVDADRIPAVLAATDEIYAKFRGPRHYVLGNHDLGDLSKDEFLGRVGAEETSSSFEVGGYHFVLLDAQYRLDGEDRADEFWYMEGYVPPGLLDWLRDDLASTELPTIVCLHQRLDLEYEKRTGGPEIANYLDVRKVLEEAGNVIAVFQGHDHGGGYSLIEGIHYITFSALIGRIGGKAPTWAYVTLDPTAQTIEIVGEGEQEDYRLEYGSP